MAPPDPRETGLDPAHILRVCERAAIGIGRHDGVRYTFAAPAGVTVGLSSAKAARAASAALVRLGYQAAPARRSRWRRDVLVSGWSPAGLESRLAALRLTIAQLRSAETATAAAVIDRYRRLSAEAKGVEADALAASQVEQQIRAMVAARCGIGAPRDLSVLPADAGDALRLRTIWALEELTDALIQRHMRVARRALAEFCALRRHASDDWAAEAAVRRMAGPPSPRGQLAGGDAPRRRPTIVPVTGRDCPAARRQGCRQRRTAARPPGTPGLPSTSKPGRGLGRAAGTGRRPPTSSPS
jgi:hypothetical protein